MWALFKNAATIPDANKHIFPKIFVRIVIVKTVSDGIGQSDVNLWQCVFVLLSVKCRRRVD